MCKAKFQQLSRKKAAPSGISMYWIGITNMASNDFTSERKMLAPVFILRSVVKAHHILEMSQVLISTKLFRTWQPDLQRMGYNLLD